MEARDELIRAGRALIDGWSVGAPDFFDRALALRDVLAGLGASERLALSSATLGVPIDDRRIVRDAVLKMLKERYANGSKVARAKTGDEIIVAWSGVKHAMNAGLPTWQEAVAALNIEVLIARADLLEVRPDKAGRADPRSTTLYQVSARFDGVDHDVTIFVRNHTDGNRYYDHVTIEKKNPAGLTGSEGGSGMEPGPTPTLPYAGSETSLAPDAPESKAVLDSAAPDRPALIAAGRALTARLDEDAATFFDDLLALRDIVVALGAPRDHPHVALLRDIVQGRHDADDVARLLNAIEGAITALHQDGALVGDTDALADDALTHWVHLEIAAAEAA